MYVQVFQKKKHLYSVSSLEVEATEKELKLEFQKNYKNSNYRYRNDKNI